LGIRDGQVILPRRLPLLETFANHLASDAKKLVEDEQTGAKAFKYIRIAANYYSLAFTYDWIACERERRHYIGFVPNRELEDWERPMMWRIARMMRNETGIEFPLGLDRKRIF